MRVAAAPEHGKANAEVVRLLADTLALETRSVRIVAGETSQNKVVEIDGLSIAAVRIALETASSA